MSSQFQPYLDSIRAAYEKWWQLYTLTDAVEKQRQSKEGTPFFDFGLMVQAVKPEKRERQADEKIERFSVLDGIRKYVDQQVLLVGRPGSGKSTALARLMLEEATKPQERIPILVELRYWQGSIEQLIHDALTRHEMPAEWVEEALRRSLILFDGVNELPSEEARSQLSAFRRNHPKLPMIFTTRDLSLGGDLGIEKKLEMQPLTEAQMQAFIRAYVPEQAEQMLRQLKDRLREFGQTPLLLWMLCGVFQQTGTLPENLGLVFREFTQGYERYLKDDVRIESDRSWWKPVLQQLAWIMMQGEKPTEFRVAIRKEKAVRAIAQFLEGKVPYAEDFAQKCLRDLQKHHLIQVGVKQEELEFRHQLIQEYYAAEALREQVGRLEDEQLKQKFLNFLKWTEPVALMLTFLNETQVTRLLELALDVDWMLSSRLIGKVELEIQEKAVSFVEALKTPNWLKIQLLKETRSAIAIPTLINLSKHWDVRIYAVEALDEICSTTAIPTLLKLIERSNFDVRTIIESKIQSKLSSSIPTIDPSIEVMIDKHNNYSRSRESNIGRSIAKPLCEEFGIEGAITTLLQLVEHSDSIVCEGALFALGNIAQKHMDAITQYLPHLITLIPTDSGKYIYHFILTIQENCKYYNYEIYQAYLDAQQTDRQTPQNNDRSSPNIHINQVGILNTGDTTIQGNQIGIKSSTPNLDRASPDSSCD